MTKEKHKTMLNHNTKVNDNLFYIVFNFEQTSN